MTKIEEKVIELHSLGLINSEIAKKIKKTGDTVAYYLKKYNLIRNGILISDINTILKDLNEGKTIYSIARDYKRSSYYISSLAKKYNIKTCSFDENLIKNRNINYNPFINLNDKETQYWLGFLAADGSIFKNRISLGLQEQDESHIDKFINFIGCNLPKKKTLKDNKYIGYRVSFKNAETVKFLSNIGITNKKSFTLFYKSKFTNDFIRGVIDGDGYIRKNHQEVSIATASKEFANQLQRFIIKNYSVNCTIRKYDNKSIYTVGVYGRLQVEKLLELTYKNASIYLERKYINASLNSDVKAIIP